MNTNWGKEEYLIKYRPNQWCVVVDEVKVEALGVLSVVGL